MRRSFVEDVGDCKLSCQSRHLVVVWVGQPVVSDRTRKGPRTKNLFEIRNSPEINCNLRFEW